MKRGGVRSGGAGSALARLIAPLEPGDFLVEYWERRPFHASSPQRETSERLLSILAVERILSNLNREPIEFTVVSADRTHKRSEYMRDDNSVDVVRLFQLFSEGYTIVLNQLHLRHEPIAALCQALEREFSMPVQCNVYLSPPDSKGFKPHYDTHDVFILQLAGSKQWRIYEPVVEFPMRGQAFRPEADVTGELSCSFELKKGEACYIPRGWGHEGQAGAETSLHATIGILSFTWAELLIEAVSATCLYNAAFREALPTDFAKSGFGGEKARAKFAELWSKLSSEIDVDSAFAHFAGRLLDTAALDLSGQIAQLESLKSLSLDSQVRLRAQTVYSLHRTEDKIIIHSHGRTIEFPAHCQSAVEFVFSTSSFRVGRLPGDLDDEAKLTLVRRLISEGLLTKVGA